MGRGTGFGMLPQNGPPRQNAAIHTHLLRFSCRPSTDDGKVRLWMTVLLWVLSRVSLRGVRCGCSPAPTKATRLVQNSILARLRGSGWQGGEGGSRRIGVAG